MLPEKNKENFILITVLVFILFGTTILLAQTYSGSPVTKARLLKVIQSKEYAVPVIVKIIKEQGVDFKVNDQVEEELLGIKANNQIIEAAKNNYRAVVVTPSTAGNTRATNTSGPSTGASNRGTSAANTYSATEKQEVSSNKQNSTEEYEQLYYQGVQLISQLRSATTQQQAYSVAQSLKDTGNRAIKLDPSRPEAYKLVGSALLLTGDFMEAERYGQQAIDRGGSLAFPVYHMTANPHPETLYIGKGFITVESNQEYFEFRNREVYNVLSQPNYNAMGRSIAIFSLITYKNNVPSEWYFTPANTYTVQEANLIMDLIRANIYK